MHSSHSHSLIRVSLKVQMLIISTIADDNVDKRVSAQHWLYIVQDLFIPRHTIVDRYYGITLAVRVSVCVFPSIHLSYFRPYVNWCMNIIIWDYELVWSNSWPKSDLYFMVQWFYATSWRQFDVLLSYFGIKWPIFHSPVCHISHCLIPKCHIYI